MAGVKNYSKEQERREVSYTEKIHKHRLSSVYRFVLIVIVIVVLAVVAYIRYGNLKYEGYETLSQTDRVSAAGAVEKRLGKGLLTYSKDGARYTDAAGEIKWNQTFEMQNPITTSCRDVVAIADYTGHKIYVYNSAEKLGEIDTTLPILSFCAAANGVVAAVLDDGDVTWIRVYSAEGNTLLEFKTTMANYGYPFSVSLSPDGILCAVSYMYMDMGEMKTSVAFYNFGEVGQNQVDNFVGGYDHANTLVPYVQFMNRNTAFAVGDDRLVFYKGNQKPENAANILFSEELQEVYYNEEYVGLVFLNGLNGGKRLDIYNAEGTKVVSHPIVIDYTDILFDNDTYIIYNETELYIGTMDGREKYNGTFTEPVNLLIPTGKSYRYMLVTQDSVETIRLR